MEFLFALLCVCVYVLLMADYEFARICVQSRGSESDLAWAMKCSGASKPCGREPRWHHGYFQWVTYSCFRSVSALTYSDENVPALLCSQTHVFVQALSLVNNTVFWVHRPPHRATHMLTGICTYANPLRYVLSSYVYRHSSTYVHTSIVCGLKAKCWLGSEDTLQFGVSSGRTVRCWCHSWAHFQIEVENEISQEICNLTMATCSMGDRTMWQHACH